MMGTATFKVERRRKDSSSWYDSKKCDVTLSGNKEVLDFIIETLSNRIECKEDMKID